MSIENAIYSRLSGYAGLSALVSTRIYPSLMPQDTTMPAVTYQRISGLPISLLSSDTDIIDARFQFSCFASTYDSGRAVVKQIRLALQRWSGTEATVTILDSLMENDTDLYDPDTMLHYPVVDFLISYRV